MAFFYFLIMMSETVITFLRLLAAPGPICGA